MPKITVVVPAYNVEQYIEDCLDSISGQTYDDYEVIVVNDGSTDATLSRAESKVDRRVRVVTQLNRGLAGARNTGVRLAKGEFVAFLDSDDRWHPEASG